jgi:hypothetical protein
MAAKRCALALLTALALAPASPGAEIRGRIGRVDLDKNEFVIEPPGRRAEPLTLRLDKDTQILFGRQAGTPADLPEGRRARVEYEARDGQLVARAVHVVGAAPARRAATLPAGEGLAGVLRRIALTDREIVVVGPGAKGPETETTIAVPEGAKILKGDKAIALDDLKENEAVRVQVEKRDGRLTAVKVEVGLAGPAGPAPADQRQDFVPRIRRVLQLVDKVLEQMEKGREPRP